MNKLYLLELLFISKLSFASQTGGTQLPYESWLKSLQESLSGPAAFSVALIGIFSCGATLIFTGGEIGRFMRSFIYIILVMTMLIGANSLMSNFFNGAAICDYQNPQITQELKSPKASHEEKSLQHFLAQDLYAGVC